VWVFVNLAALVLIVCLPIDVEAASCRGYPQDVRAAIKKHVEALRALEHEAADRLKGLDTRTFEYLLVQARGTAAAIADKDALAKEEGLDRCRGDVPPVRRTGAAHLCGRGAGAGDRHRGTGCGRGRQGVETVLC
jgi:hypothetical protein